MIEESEHLFSKHMGFSIRCDCSRTGSHATCEVMRDEEGKDEKIMKNQRERGCLLE